VIEEEAKEYDDRRMQRRARQVDNDAMSMVDTVEEYVLTLRRSPVGRPCGTLRASGARDVRQFEGWIGLIGLITEHGRTIMDHAATMRRVYELISAGDLDGYAALVADDFVEHEEISGIPPTKEGMLDYFRMLLTAFPAMRMEIDDLIVADDKAVARVIATARHDGEFMGIPATGTTASIQLIDIMRFDDAGLVAEHWGVADMFSLMQQLGVVSA
jgi:steroid delta-isomerase-like uncharacterized protein